MRRVLGVGFGLAFLLPLAVLVLSMPIGLYVTGEGDILQGSGSTSVLWAVLASTLVACCATLAVSWPATLHAVDEETEALLRQVLSVG